MIGSPHSDASSTNRAVGIVLPCPNMQRIKRRKLEAVGELEVVKQLSHQLGRIVRMIVVPLLSKHQNSLRR